VIEFDPKLKEITGKEKLKVLKKAKHETKITRI